MRNCAALLLLIGLVCLSAAAHAAERITLSGRLVGFFVDPFYRFEAELIDEDGKPDGKMTGHMACAVADFDILEPSERAGRQIRVNFTDGRFMTDEATAEMERAREEKAVFEFSIPADFFDGDYGAIEGGFVEDLKRRHSKAVDPTPESAPRNSGKASED